MKLALINNLAIIGDANQSSLSRQHFIFSLKLASFKSISYRYISKEIVVKLSTILLVVQTV